MTKAARWFLRASILFLLAIAVFPALIRNVPRTVTLELGPRQPPLTRSVVVTRDSIFITFRFGRDWAGYFTTQMAVAIQRPPSVEDAGERTPESQPP